MKGVCVCVCHRVASQGDARLPGQTSTLDQPAGTPGSGGYLSQGEGHGVLRVRASDLDDVFELVCLGGEGVVEPLQAGQQHLVDLRGRRDVHGRREGVVGALEQTHNRRLYRV